MKKISMIVLALVMTFSLVACGRQNNNETSAPSTTASDRNPTIIPDMDPTIDTNIPDPDVDTKMPMYTDGTEGTNGMSQDNQNSTNGIGS